jgi:hypothetical protein
MANVRKRILELTALESASLNTTIVGVDGGTTYKIELDTLADAVTSRVNILDRDRLASLESVTSSFETKGRSVVSGSSQLTSSLDTRYTLSGSVPTTPTGSFATTGSNTFIGNQIISGSVGIRANSGSWNFLQNGTLVLPNGTGIYGNGLLQIDVVGGFLLTSYTDQFGSGSQEWYFHSDGTLNVPGNIEGADNLLTTSSFNTYTSSQSSLNTAFTNGITARLQTSSFNSYTASQSTSSLVDRLNTIESVSGSWITESETGSFLTSLSGAISSSSQLTSSFDTRYLNTGGDGVISGSAQLPSGLISGSTQLTTSFPSKTTGNWSVPAGASTQSFTVEAGASYTMWVNGNIPNGIITWNATVTTSNTNVPVVGSQYGWYYTAGNALVLTAMPDQIIGTTNTLISSPASYAPNTSNVFKFGITNNSGTTQTINYGYIKLS